MIVLDVTHTGHATARTGIQQVTRQLLGALPGAAGITFDPRWGAWRSLDPRETLLARGGSGTARSRGARWTQRQQWRGRLGRWFGRNPPFPVEAGALIAPEIFSPGTAAAYRRLFPRIHGPRVAIIHDTIPMTHPELTPPGTVARFPTYLDELRQFDAIAAVSETTRDSLREFWQWAGAADVPPVVAIRTAVVRPPGPVEAPPATGVPQVLCVGTIEGRKNHAALLDAAGSLWAGGVQFELHLVGMARPETAAGAIGRIQALRAAGRPLYLHGAIDDRDLDRRWYECRFSVYPSIVEGFGLPVVESVARGRPCICSAHGATAEAASGGGCMPLDSVEPDSIARAMRRLLEDGAEYERLCSEAAARPVRTWADYARDIRDWLGTVRRRGMDCS